MAGPTGLDYASVAAWMHTTQVRKQERRSLLEKLQIMERATLEEWARRAERKGGTRRA